MCVSRSANRNEAEWRIWSRRWTNCYPTIKLNKTEQTSGRGTNERERRKYSSEIVKMVFIAWTVRLLHTLSHHIIVVTRTETGAESAGSEYQHILTWRWFIVIIKNNCLKKMHIVIWSLFFFSLSTAPLLRRKRNSCLYTHTHTRQNWKWKENQRMNVQ